MPKFNITSIQLITKIGDQLYRKVIINVKFIQSAKSSYFKLIPCFVSGEQETPNLENHRLKGMMEALPETLAFRSLVCPQCERL